jgi:hypothetical protein
VVIGNHPLVASAPTVTAVGTVNAGSPVELKGTKTPPSPAGFDSVTVQVPLAFAPNVVGVHCSEEITVAATRLIFTLCDTPLYVAVNVPFWSAPAAAPVLTVNGPVVEPAVTITVAGTVNLDSPLAHKDTETPPFPAGFDRVTMQLLLVFAPSVVGVHCSEEITIAAVRLMFTLCEVPP